MIVYALVIWFGAGNTQSSFAVSNIESKQECERLGRELSAQYRYVFAGQAKCFPYRIPKT